MTDQLEKCPEKRETFRGSIFPSMGALKPGYCNQFSFENAASSAVGERVLLLVESLALKALGRSRGGGGGGRVGVGVSSRERVSGDSFELLTSLGV